MVESAPAFISTPLAKRIFALCDKARRRRRLGLIFGESQIGKTSALVAYQEKHHAEPSTASSLSSELSALSFSTLYLRVPTHASLTSLMAELAEALRLPATLRGGARRRAILDRFAPGDLLLVDEAHGASAAALDFCRELHDRRGCGVVFAGLPVLGQALTLGPEARRLRPLVRRALPPLQLPAAPGWRELEAFARAFGLEPAGADELGARVTHLDDTGRERTHTIAIAPAELQRRVITADGLGRWCTILEEARDLAQEKRRALTWPAVIAAWHTLERLGRGEDDDAKEAA